jgi:hypothetical protein
MSADGAEARRSLRRRRRTRAALVGSAAGVAVTAVVLLAVGLGSAPTTSAPPARQSQPLGPTSTGSVSSTSTSQADSSDGLVPGPGRSSLDRPVPRAALADLRAAVHGLTVARPNYVGPVRARLVHCQVDRWRSSEHFTLLVSLDLHFATEDTTAWNEGSNGRFVRFIRSPGSSRYHLTWATSPF